MYERLVAEISGAWATVTLVDSEGVVLKCTPGREQVSRYLEEVGGSAPGFSFRESLAGTNSIGLVLMDRGIARVVGHEHFSDSWIVEDCVAAPVHDPFSGRIVGVLDLALRRTEAMALQEEVMVRSAALAIERRLLKGKSERERALLRAYTDAAHRARAGEENRVDLASPAMDSLSRADRLLLDEKALELIASGQRAAAEVPLSGGRVVTLVAEPVAEGLDGLAVEALLPAEPASAPVHPAGRQRLQWPAEEPSGPVSHALGARGSGPAPSAPAPGRDVSSPAARTAGEGASRWLQAVGEPSAGRSAVIARNRLQFLHEAGRRVGTTLDVIRTAEELTEVVTGHFADAATVDLHPAVLSGDDPVPSDPRVHRAAVSGQHDIPFYAVGDQVVFEPSTPQARCLACVCPVIEQDLTAADSWAAQDPERSARILDQGIHSLIVVPLTARDTVLGTASFYRAQGSAPFEDDDLSLASELATSAAVCIDNARRYTRERTAVLALQRRLLPEVLPEHTTLETAHRYLPAHAAVGGDWFDVIPLSGTRIAMVVGDVVGHGVHAAAAMGRLRTAVHNFSAFDLAPDELLTHLDNLVDQMVTSDQRDADVLIGTTCLYAVYDPTTRRCSLARAGHFPAALVLPDGTATFPELPANPPLGLGGLPFEAVDIDLPDDSQLVLYTDGLFPRQQLDVEASMEDLRRTLAHPGRSPEQTCRAVIERLPAPQSRTDDLTLLVARAHGLPSHHMAGWDDLPADPAIVPLIRAAATRRLNDWHLQDAVFATELIVTELLSNAIRHATGPIHLRLLRDRTLVCEVSDASNTSPHMRQAAGTDEGGRGLFLVAQLAQRWGTRYIPRGKVIWAEQAVPPP
ncbi:SpoIIE family protein phosphatase [Streptomyces anandii]|uniref:SpoIIE family protein phosphatase n=1 Tax=Streptomyces anandii TaxID=285454 RepID=UPI0037B22A72